jgi:hypothetical protein
MGPESINESSVSYLEEFFHNSVENFSINESNLSYNYYNDDSNSNSNYIMFNKDEDRMNNLGDKIQEIFSQKKDNPFDDYEESQTKNSPYFSTKQTDQNINVVKIFYTKKVQKITKRGRRNSGFISFIKPKHSRKTKDNLVRKIKRHFIKSLINYINYLYKNHSGKSKEFLKKIKPKFVDAPNNQESLNFFYMTLRQIFSEDLSKKYVRFSPDYNRKQIEILYDKNEPKEVIDIMNKTLKEMYEIYVSNQIDEFKLEKDLSEIESKAKKDILYEFKIRETAKQLIHNLVKKSEKQKKTEKHHE